jgi:hypothetical protein
MPREVYLVGSVPMVSASEVFAKVSAALGSRLKWLPDGETGERADWITWLEPVFAEHPAFAKSGEFFRMARDASAICSEPASSRRTSGSTISSPRGKCERVQDI